MEKDRNTDGRFKSDTTDAEILAGVRAHEPAATSEVATEVDMTRQGADRRLRRLRDEGRVNSKKIGASLVWFAPQQDATPDQSPTNPGDTEGELKGSIETSLDDDLPGEDVGEDAGAPTPSDTPERRETSEDGRELTEAISQVDTPGSGETREKREHALREAYEYLRAEGTASKSDFDDLLGDDVGYASFNSWWTNYVKAKDALKQLPNVDAPAEGEHTWTYTGEDADPVEDSGIYDPTKEFDQ